MAEENTAWWKDPGVLSDAIVLAGAGGAAIFSILDLIGVFSLAWFTVSISKLTLVLVSILTLSLVLERRIHAERFRLSLLAEIRHLSSQALGEVDMVYSGRSDLPSFKETVGNARDEIFIAAVLFGYVALQERAVLQRKAELGCRVKFLFPDPGEEGRENPILEPLWKTLAIPHAKAVMATSLQTLAEWTSALPPSTRDRIETRFTSTVPTHVALLVDPSLSSGLIQLEMLPPRTDVSKRWSVRLVPSTGGTIYKTYATAYERLWQDATPVDFGRCGHWNSR